MISILLRRLSCLTGSPRVFRPGMQGLIPLSFDASLMPVGIVAPVGQKPLRLWQAARKGGGTRIVTDLACGHEFEG